jgi:hypothetical protein
MTEEAQMVPTRLAAAALAALGAAAAIPVALAQLDFAGVVDALDVDAGDTPEALVVLAGVSGVVTLGVVCLALAGAALVLADAAGATTVLGVAAVAGFVSATIFWIPPGVCLGAAVAMLDRTKRAADASLADAAG